MDLKFHIIEGDYFAENLCYSVKNYSGHNLLRHTEKSLWVAVRRIWQARPR